MPKHASPERKAHAYLLLSAYTRAEMSYAEVARITAAHHGSAANT